MTYDTALAIFSPDGRLLQVERAYLASSQGPALIFTIHPDCIKIAMEKRPNALVIEDELSKISLIDPLQNFFLSFSGLSPDSSEIKRSAIWMCRNYKYTTGENISIMQLAEKIADLRQKNTITGGKRPFGVRTVLFGFENEFKAFVIEPDGNFSEYKKGAVGNKCENVIKYFDEKEGDVLEGIYEIVQNDVNRVCCLKITKSGVERESNDYVSEYLNRIYEQELLKNK